MTTTTVKSLITKQHYQEKDDVSGGRIVLAKFYHKLDGFTRLQSEGYDKTILISDNKKYATTIDKNIESVIYEYISDLEQELIQTIHLLEDGSTVKVSTQNSAI